MDVAASERNVSRALARAEARRSTRKARRKAARRLKLTVAVTCVGVTVGLVEAPAGTPEALMPSDVPMHTTTHEAAANTCSDVHGCRTVLHHVRRALAWQKDDRAYLRNALSRAQRLAGVSYAIRLASLTWHVPESAMRSVAWCESRLSPSSWNSSSGASGLYQFLPSTFSHTPYGRAGLSIFDPAANSLAAAWLVTQDGGWGEWSCRP